MNTANKSLKIYQVPFLNKVKIVLQHYEFGMPIIDSLKASKFKIIDEFADSLMYHHDKNSDENQDFLFTINMESFTEEAVKEYLIKQKKFVLDYIISRGYFMGSHIYQLYLEYIPYELTDIEKSIFLDCYINMVTDIRGTEVSNKKRKRLEYSLHINQD